MIKHKFSTALTKSAKKAIKRSVYRKQTLKVRVGNVSVVGRTVKQCFALTKCAKSLSKSTPTSVKAGIMAINSGAMDPTRAVNTAKELAETTPLSVKGKGFSCTAGKPWKVVAIVAAIMGIGIGGKLLYNWANKKYFFSHKQDGTSDDDAYTPTEQSIDQIRNESSFEHYDDGQLVGKLIYNGDKVIIFSEPGTGKTVLAMGLALDIASGNASKIIPDDSGVHKPQTVFYYDGENDPEDYVKIFGNETINSQNLHVIRGFYYPNPTEWLSNVRIRLQGTKGDVTVILDNISCVVSTFNPNTVRELFIRDFNRIQSEFAPSKVTFIVVAHTNKQNELIGSNNQENFATAILKLSKHDEDHLKLEVIKNRKYGDMKGKTIMLAKRETEDGFKYDEYVGDTVSSNDGKRTSKADKIPEEEIREIIEFYQKGVPGHGLGSIIKEFHLDTKYGIRESKEVSRIIESYGK